jgi:hypothetical protein
MSFKNSEGVARGIGDRLTQSLQPKHASAVAHSHKWVLAAIQRQAAATQLAHPICDGSEGAFSQGKIPQSHEYKPKVTCGP